jgi:hypothetical protein
MPFFINSKCLKQSVSKPEFLQYYAHIPTILDPFLKLIHSVYYTLLKGIVSQDRVTNGDH